MKSRRLVRRFFHGYEKCSIKAHPAQRIGAIAPATEQLNASASLSMSK
ncbi:hypothetical protein DW66_5368 [Pseudomonas putida]|nr:hypothetical protein DW66_5368 [Pseudomonas putida]